MKKILVSTIILLSVAVYLFAQTAITVDMLRFTGPGDILMKVGQIIQPVLLDTSVFTLDTTTSPPTLRLNVTGSTTYVELAPTVLGTAQAVFDLPDTPKVNTTAVHRNGLRMARGIDYNVDLTQRKVTFIANLPKVGDTIVISYVK